MKRSLSERHLQGNNITGITYVLSSKRPWLKLATLLYDRISFYRGRLLERLRYVQYILILNTWNGKVKLEMAEMNNNKLLNLRYSYVKMS